MLMKAPYCTLRQFKPLNLFYFFLKMEYCIKSIYFIMEDKVCVDFWVIDWLNTYVEAWINGYVDTYAGVDIGFRLLFEWLKIKPQSLITIRFCNQYNNLNLIEHLKNCHLLYLPLNIDFFIWKNRQKFISFFLL